MSSSPMEKPPHRHITDATVSRHRRRNSHEESRDPDPEAYKYADYENQGVLESAKIVPKGAAHRLKHHFTEPYSSDRPGAVEGFSDSGRVVAYVERGEVNGGARKSDIYETKKQPVEEPWNLYIPNIKGKVYAVPARRSVGPPRLPPVGILRNPQMPRNLVIAGAPRPRNTLNYNSGETQLKSKSSTRPFSLKNDEYIPDGDQGGRPPKRQRTGGNHAASSHSPGEVINLADASPTTQSNGSRLAARSGQGQNQPGQHRYSDHLVGQTGFSNVENKVRNSNQRPLRKKSTPTDGPRGRGFGGDILRYEGIEKQKRARASESLDISLNEISDDPIQDDDDQERSKVTHVPEQKPLFEIRIPYAGTANLHSPRDKDGNGKALARAPTDTGERSPFFAQSNGHPHPPRGSRNSTTFNVDQQSRNSHTSEQMGPPKHLPLKRDKRPVAPAPYEDEASIDELAIVEPQNPREVAWTLLEAQRNYASHSDTYKQDRANVEVVDSDSDDELNTQRCNINHSEFGSKTGAKIAESKTTKTTKPVPAKKAKQPDTISCHTYTIVEMFTAHKRWLERNSKTWSIIYSHDDRALRVSDEVNSFQMDILTSKVARIEMSNECSKIVIHRMKSLQAAELSSMVYLDFGEASQAKEFQKQFEKLEGNSIRFISKPAHYLENVFESNRNKKAEPKPQRRTRGEEPEDIRLAKKKQEKMLEGGWGKHHNSTNNGNTQSTHIATDSNDPKNSQRSHGLRKGMETPTVEISDDDAQNPNYQVSKIAPNSFYGSEAEAYHETRSSSRKNINPPRKARSPTPVLGWTLQNHNWEEGWHSSLIFAGDGKARATIESTDIPKLDEGEFLNDSLIYFYLLYLQKRLADAQPDLANRIYVQNSFFYERLTKEATGKSRINYEGVRKWTDRANVDIFTKDYIIIPVNENLHWYVAIICNAPKLLSPDIKTEESSSQQSNEKSEDHGLEDAAPVMTTETSTPPQQVVSGVDAKIAELCLDDASKKNKSGRSRFEDSSNPSTSKEPSPKEANVFPNDKGSDKRKRENGGDDDVAPVISDILQAPARPVRKGKRPSTARKYDPKEPRIITLDSFGHPHSPACNNLKEYLVAELKEKHRKEIPPLGPIGMTAKGIPLQNNYCDCGVFLLGYMERFFENPDGFVGGLLSGGQTDLETTWVNAPEMRNSIRDILFKLPKEQAPEPGKNKERKKTKIAPNSGTISDSVASSKAVSKEVSKSARPSISSDEVESNRPPAAVTKTPKGTEKSVPLEEPQPKSATSTLPTPSIHVAPKRAKRRVNPEGGNHRRSEVPESDVEDLEPSSKASPSPAEALEPKDSHTMLGSSEIHGVQLDQADESPLGIYGMLTDKLARFTKTKFWAKKSNQDEVANSGATESNPLEIEDFQTNIAYEAKQISKPRSAEQKYGPMVEDEYATSKLHGRQVLPDLENSFGTEPSQPRDSSDEAMEPPSSVGLNEPYANRSSSPTVAGTLTARNEQGDDYDDEMLLSYTTQHAARSSSSSPPSVPRVSSFGMNSSKKRYHSASPATRKRLRVEEEEKDLQHSSEGSADQFNKQWLDNDVNAFHSRSSISRNGSGTHTKFDQ